MESLTLYLSLALKNSFFLPSWFFFFFLLFFLSSAAYEVSSSVRACIDLVLKLYLCTVDKHVVSVSLN